MKTTPHLGMLTADDLEKLARWTRPLATMRNPGVSVWGQAALQAVVDEQHQRSTGVWPTLTWPTAEALVLVGNVLSSLRGAGSAYLAAWCDVLGDQLVDELASRADRSQ